MTNNAVTESGNIDLSGAKVLIVDDTPANIDVLRKVLQPEGYKLFVANSGERALQIAVKAVPDLILLDIMMPGMDGFETCQHLKADALTAEIPVIFITAKTDTDDLVKGFQQGAVDYITKPFRQEEACVRVRTHLQSRLLMKQRTGLIEELQTTNERFRLLAAWSPLGIYQANTEGHIIYTNQQWKAIWGIEETESTAWLNLIVPEDRSEVENRWQASIHEGKSFSHQFRIDKAGEERWLQLYATAVPGSQGGWVGTLEDITKSKRAAEAQAKAKSQMVADMAHELRTPLNAIIGYSELLTEEAEDSGTEAEDLGKITQTSKYLLSLINNILDLSKIGAGKMPLHPESTVISELFDNVLTSINPLVKRNKNTLIVGEVKKLDTLYTDKMKLQQILINLLSNACKFTENGDIYLRARQQQEEGQTWFYFDVQDTGIGMTEEQTQKLFHKYVQASDMTSVKYGGTGLGLVLSREFSRLMGGDISVVSIKGQGSTFTVKLPANIDVA